MFKKLFAILIALLMLCSCGVPQETEKPVVPEEQEIPEAETPVIPELEAPELLEPSEPELIKEHIVALNEARHELFFAEYVQDVYYEFYFEDENSYWNSEWNTVPDVVVQAGTENGSTEGLFYDFYERTVMEVTNFKTKDEVREYMRQWLDDSVFEKEGSNVDFNFMEFDGKLYLLRGNRGYGVVSYGNTEILSETETEITAVTHIYHFDHVEAGTADIRFEKRDGNWIITCVDENYYNEDTTSDANPPTGKPVIYLYPEKETLVAVNLDFDGKLTYTYPELGSGWKVLAKPDGTLTNLADNSTHYYLFWEGTARPKWTYEKGFVVKGSETESFLRENLAKMGLTPREYNDFITYWVPKMQENPYNLISFSGDEYSEIAKLTVNPKPESVIRIHMMWKALDEPIEIEPQVLPFYQRKGFTLVEWGGTEIY